MNPLISLIHAQICSVAPFSFLGGFFFKEGSSERWRIHKLKYIPSLTNYHANKAVPKHCSSLPKLQLNSQACLKLSVVQLETERKRVKQLRTKRQKRLSLIHCQINSVFSPLLPPLSPCAPCHLPLSPRQ